MCGTRACALVDKETERGNAAHSISRAKKATRVLNGPATPCGSQSEKTAWEEDKSACLMLFLLLMLLIVADLHRGE